MRRAVAAVVAVLAVTAAMVWLLPSPRDGDTDGGGDGAARGERTDPSPATTLTAGQRAQQERASAWMKEARAALGDLGIAVPELVRRTDDWLVGEAEPSSVRADLATWQEAFTSSRRALYALDELDLAPSADRLFELSAELYVEVGRIHGVALDVGPDSDLGRQVHLLGRRVRVLADRIFDRGFALVEPYLFQEDDPNVILHLPDEVPVWSSLELAPGPPLAPEPPPYEGGAPFRQEVRPGQERAGWVSALKQADPPDTADLAGAITAGADEDLRLLAKRLVGVVESLRHEPDPGGDREESARVRLGLLVHADAARAAQAATLLEGEPNGALVATARRLVDIGGDPVLWVEELPGRSRGAPGGRG